MLFRSDVIYSRPANTFVATFIGSPPMNVLKVTRTAKGMDLQAKEGNGAAAWEMNLASSFKGIGDANDLLLGIRPEHILIGDKAAGIPTLQVPARVDLIEPMGAETYLYLQAHGHNLIARVDPSTHAEVGQTVTAHIPQARFHLFDEKSTNRIPRQNEA